jgi:hypothetical protein
VIAGTLTAGVEHGVDVALFVAGEDETETLTPVIAVTEERTYAAADLREWDANLLNAAYRCAGRTKA